MSTISSTTVRSRYVSALNTLSDPAIAAALAAMGTSAEAQAKAQIVSAYADSMVELDGKPVKLTSENFDLVVLTESDKLAMAGEKVIAAYKERAQELLTALEEIWASANEALKKEDARLGLDDLPEFTVRTGRRGGGGGGGSARVTPDFSKDVYTKSTSKGVVYTLTVLDRGEDGNPTLFGVTLPDGEPIGIEIDGTMTYEFSTHTRAKDAVCHHAGMSLTQNARTFWGIPEKEEGEASE